MRPAREITEKEENFRTERMEGTPFLVSRRDPVEPEPVGTVVLMAFRITGYDRDCDGSLMARLDRIDKGGEETGWSPDKIGLFPDSTVVVTSEEWKAMFDR